MPRRSCPVLLTAKPVDIEFDRATWRFAKATEILLRAGERLAAREENRDIVEAQEPRGPRPKVNVL